MFAKSKEKNKIVLIKTKTTIVFICYTSDFKIYWPEHYKS